MVAALNPNPVIAPEFEYLINLENLFLTRCGLTDTIPQFIGTKLTKLKWLCLNINSLKGAIPNLSGLTQLQYLYLTNNNLGLDRVTGLPTSGIPPELTLLTNLVELNLDFNKLIGPIPTIWNCTQLNILLLNDNKLIKGIPSALRNLSNLAYLILNNNRLGYNAQLADGSIAIGSIPTHGIPTNLWTNLSNLQLLGFHTNDLVGTIPPVSAGNLLRLQVFEFHNNRIDSVPNLSSLQNLVDLRKFGNKLTFDDILYNLPNAPSVPSNRNVLYTGNFGEVIFNFD